MGLYPEEQNGQTAPELAILLQRAAFNRALADRDLSGIGSFLAANAILVGGTDSAIISGRKAQLLAWKREFAAAQPTIYARMPEAITVSSVEPFALEHGHWQGVAASGGELRASGAYTAKWRRIDTARPILRRRRSGIPVIRRMRNGIALRR